MCDKAVIDNDGTLKSVPDCCENQEICNKEVDNYPPALEFVSECFMTQEMYIKQLIDVFVFASIPDRCKTQEMCNRVVSEDFFSIRYVPK